MDKKNLGVAGVLGIVAMVLLNTMTVFVYPEVSRVDMNDLAELTEAQFNGESKERVMCNHDYKTG